LSWWLGDGETSDISERKNLVRSDEKLFEVDILV